MDGESPPSRRLALCGCRCASLPFLAASLPRAPALISSPCFVWLQRALSPFSMLGEEYRLARSLENVRLRQSTCTLRNRKSELALARRSLASRAFAYICRVLLARENVRLRQSTCSSLSLRNRKSHAEFTLARCSLVSRAFAYIYRVLLARGRSTA